jgi:hypothetical protein
MRKIDHADDAVNHRIADRDQPIDGPERQAIDQLLQEIFHMVSRAPLVFLLFPAVILFTSRETRCKQPPPPRDGDQVTAASLADILTS